MSLLTRLATCTLLIPTTTKYEKWLLIQGSYLPWQVWKDYSSTTTSFFYLSKLRFIIPSLSTIPLIFPFNIYLLHLFHVTGTGVAGFNRDLHPATASQLAYPYDLAIDNSGNLYISGKLREVTPPLIYNTYDIPLC